MVLRVPVGPFSRRWVAHHDGFESGRQFRDRQVSGPFAEWQHVHRFEPAPDGGSVLEDRIRYVLPFGPLGRLLGSGKARSELRRMFRFRHLVTAGDLERQEAWRAGPSRRIAVTGASGLVGSALRAFLSTAGQEVLPVVRRQPAEAGEIAWDPTAGTTEPAAWDGVDAVVHLAGENIAAGRWNDERKRRIRDSRVRGTRLVAETLAGLERPPRVLVCASAIGYYGDRGDEIVDEDSPAGEGFLAEVCREWEQASEAAERAGIRVVRVRIGVVLSARGGALKKMLPIFRAGLGGVLGSGDQLMSWIALDDLIGILSAALVDERMRGAVNAVAPEPASNTQFTRALGAVLRRPTLVPVPAIALRALAGEMAQQLLLASTGVKPNRLLEAGFPFRTPDLVDALRFELGRLESDPDGFTFETA